MLLGAVASATACADSDDVDPIYEPPRRHSAVDGGGAGAIDATAIPDGDAGKMTQPCPHPEEPSHGTFTRIYDPSVGETKPFYINDHTFVRDEGGTWHLFGITHAEPQDPFDEKAFAHATAPSLLGPWTKKPSALVADPKYGETLLWAPYVLRDGKTYYMFYCGGGSDRTRFQIRLATSTDLVTWTREPAPLFTDGYDARDPMVLRVGNQWVLYYTANSSPTGGNHVVAYRTSTDLRSWGDKHIAFTDPSTGSAAGPTESPFVVARGSDYYLFIGPREAYSDTAVFHSKDPFHFDPNDQVYRFAAHATEIVQDVDGTTYASHSGWEQGGVHLAPLEWRPTDCRTLEGSGYRATIEIEPSAGILELVANGRNLASTSFRRSGPYVGVGGFATDFAGAAQSVDVSADGKRVALRGIPFGDRPVTADWTVCASDGALDQTISWHVQSSLDDVREIALGVNTRLARARDATHTNAEGDYPGFGSWALLGDDTTSLIAAYAPGSAWREDNRWLSSRRASASFQPVWNSAGIEVGSGHYDGGAFRLVVSDKPDDVGRAAEIASSFTGPNATCTPPLGP